LPTGRRYGRLRGGSKNNAIETQYPRNGCCRRDVGCGCARGHLRQPRSAGLGRGQRHQPEGANRPGASGPEPCRQRARFPKPAANRRQRHAAVSVLIQSCSQANPERRFAPSNRQERIDRFILKCSNTEFAIHSKILRLAVPIPRLGNRFRGRIVASRTVGGRPRGGRE
jgi:hypothetical protein